MLTLSKFSAPVRAPVASPSSRLLARTLLALVGGALACTDATGGPLAVQSKGREFVAQKCALPSPFVAPGCPVDLGGAGFAGSSGACDGRCARAPYGVYLNAMVASSPYCRFHCEEDRDCPDAQRCVCGVDGVGMCGNAECTSAAECGAGKTCRVKDDERLCSPGPGVELVCAGAGDECLADSDCPGERFTCRRASESEGGRARSCQGPVACGRPLLAASGPLLAEIRRAAAWV